MGELTLTCKGKKSFEQSVDAKNASLQQKLSYQKNLGTCYLFDFLKKDLLQLYNLVLVAYGKISVS